MVSRLGRQQVSAGSQQVKGQPLHHMQCAPSCTVLGVCVCVRACLWSLFNCGTPPSLPSAQIPLLMKKEEIFDLLCEHSVPMSRATWFIKVRGGSCALW